MRLPGGRSGATVWRRVLGELAGALDSAAFERLLRDSAIVSYRAGTVTVQVASAAAADALATSYRPLVERRLNAALPQPVAVCFVASEPAATAQPASDDPPAPAASRRPAPLSVSAADADLGRQLWRATLAAMAADLSADERERLAGVCVLGEAPDGALLLGVPSAHVARTLEGRRRAPVERALGELLGRTVVIQALDADAWTVTP